MDDRHSDGFPRCKSSETGGFGQAIAGIVRRKSKLRRDASKSTKTDSGCESGSVCTAGSSRKLSRLRVGRESIRR